MRLVSGFLQRYTNLKAPERVVREAFITAVRDVLEIDIPEDQVHIRNKTVRLSTSSTIKSEIHLHQSDILERVQKDLGDPYCISAIY